MENKDELEVKTTLGADTKNKETSKKDLEIEELQKQTQELQNKGIDIQGLSKTLENNIEKILDDEEDEIRQNWLEAYERISDEFKAKISEEELEDIIQKDIKNLKIDTSREELKKLADERQKLIEEKGQKILKQISENLGGDMGEAQKTWKAMKRAFLIGMFFGIPGAILMITKDLIDQQKLKNNILEKIDLYSKTQDSKYLQQIKDDIYKTAGSIVDVKNVTNYLVETEIKPLLNNTTEQLKAVVNYVIEDKDIVEKSISDFLENNKKEEIENIKEDEEDEEDPEPVEGMKFGM